MHLAKRYHDISCGHRVVGHEGKCRFLHGHNYRVHFTCEAGLDSVGRVIDFGVIKEKLCMWLEDHWDHKFLVWGEDDLLYRIYDGKVDPESEDLLFASIVFVPFNPTAENMAEYLVNGIGPEQLEGTGVKLVEVTVEETRKCSATYKVAP